MENNFPMTPAAKWLVAITAAIFSCILCACVMFGVNMGVVYSVTNGHMPIGYDAGAQLGAELARTNPLYGISSLLMFCLPPAIMLPAAVAAYFVVDRYQKHKLDASQQMPGPTTELINKG